MVGLDSTVLQNKKRFPCINDIANPKKNRAFGAKNNPGYQKPCGKSPKIFSAFGAKKKNPGYTKPWGKKIFPKNPGVKFTLVIGLGLIGRAVPGSLDRQ